MAIKRELVTDDEVNRMISLLGITNAPLVQRGVKTAIAFFRDVIYTDPFEWVQEAFVGIDFHSEVEDVKLKSQTKLARYQTLEDRRAPEVHPKKAKPFYFYTNAGGSESRTGTNYPIHRFELYVVQVNTWALLSRASGMGVMRWGTRLKDGGGTQYIIARHDAPQLHRQGQIYQEGLPGFRELQRAGM